MLKLRALNEESSEESEEEDIPLITREAQEQSAFSDYNRALELLRKQNIDGAKSILEELLNNGFLSEVIKPKGTEGLRQPALVLKYSCLKNMGSILEKQEDLKGALVYYFQAADLDNSDVTLWYRVGTIAVKIVDYELASEAFLEGLRCSSRHWPCMDNLVTVLYVLNDYITCLFYISKALQADPHFLKGLTFRDKILIEQPSIVEEFNLYWKGWDLKLDSHAYKQKEGELFIKEALDMRRKRREICNVPFGVKCRDTVRLEKPLSSMTWLALGESLIHLHHHIGTTSIVDVSYSSRVKLLGKDGNVTIVPETKDEVQLALDKDNLEADAEVVNCSGPSDQDDQKSKKRRRNSLSFIEQWMWGGQRRSARVRSTVRRDAERDDGNLGQALRRLVPTALLPCGLKEDKQKAVDSLKDSEDSLNTMELYRLFERRESTEDKKELSPSMLNDDLVKVLLAEGYFYTKDRLEQVQATQGSGKHQDIVISEDKVPQTKTRDNSSQLPVHSKTTDLERKKGSGVRQFKEEKQTCSSENISNSRLRENSVELVSSISVLERMVPVNTEINHESPEIEELILECEEVDDDVDDDDDITGRETVNLEGVDKKEPPIVYFQKKWTNFENSLQFGESKEIIIIDETAISVKEVELEMEIRDSSNDQVNGESTAMEIDQPDSSKIFEELPEMKLAPAGTVTVSFEEENMKLHNTISKCVTEKESEVKVEQATADVLEDLLEKLEMKTSREMLEVEEFIKTNDNKDLIDLLIMFMTALGEKWALTWPKGLPKIFTDAYECMRQHVDHPSVFSPNVNPEWLQVDAKLALYYGELVLDRWLTTKSAVDTKLSYEGMLVAELVGQLSLIASREDWSGDQHSDFMLRLHWFKAHFFLNQGNVDGAMNALDKLQFYYENKAGDVILPNCKHHNVINQDTSLRLLITLTRNQNLREVQYLYNEHHYEDLAEILQETFRYSQQHQAMAGMPVSATPTVDRATQLAMLLDALWHLKKYQECFYWGEACCNEALHKYLNCDEVEQNKWSNTIEKLLSALESCIDKGGLCVVDSLGSTRLSRLVQNLTHMLCHQLEVPDSVIEMPIESVTPWILLQQVLQWEEEKGKSQSSADVDDDIPGYILVLFTAHEYLAKRSWCCSNEGALLLHTMDVVLPRLRNPELALVRDRLNQGLEQAFYCLYAHTSKKNKARYLQDHGVPQILLTWQRAQQLYQFYQPDELPEFDSYRVSTVTADVECLLKRIIGLIPQHCNPALHVDKMNSYIEGETDELPVLGASCLQLPRQVAPIYYLLADYYFKSNEWAKAIKHYMLDVCVNPVRLDSWAGMALAMGSQLETKLNSCELLREDHFLKQARMARRCFRRALNIDSSNSVLWIEFGSFVYMAHSFCSRLLKQETDSLSMEMFEVWECQKEEMLDLAIQCFTSANKVWYAMGEESGLQDERWLHHYMLGKVTEKREEHPATCFNHYTKASKLLTENQASYCRKISYNNPQNLAVEALEVTYRIHARMLKYLEQYEGKPISKDVLQLFERTLDTATQGPFLASFKEQERKIEIVEEKRKRQSSVDDVGVECEAIPPKRTCMDLVHIPIDVFLMQDVIDVMEDLLGKVSKVPALRKRDLSCDAKTAASTTSIMEIVISDEEDRVEVELMDESVDNQENVEVLATTVLNEVKESVTDENTDKIMETPLEGEELKPIESLESKKCVVEKRPTNRRGSLESTTTTTTTTSETSSSSSDDNSTSSEDSSESSSSDSSDSDSEDADKTAETVVEVQKKRDKAPSKEELSEVEDEESSSKDHFELIGRCLAVLEECVLRFPQHYKSVYRLTNFYFHSKLHRDVGKCRDLLLGTHKCRQFAGRPHNTTFQGLFAERKNNNFFNGVWRIPVSEIDRPGSFASHMSRCVSLLMEVLKEQKDHRLLLELCLQLRRTPDTDKKYLRDGEREQLSRLALSLSVQALRGKVNQAKNNVPVLLEVHRAYQYVQKQLPHKETTFANLLVEAYKHHMQVNSAVLDQAVKFCQTKIVANRVVTPPVTPTTSLPTPHVPNLTSSPAIMPTPLLKKVATSQCTTRARGRPTGSSRATPSVTNAMMDLLQGKVGHGGKMPTSHSALGLPYLPMQPLPTDPSLLNSPLVQGNISSFLEQQLAQQQQQQITYNLLNLQMSGFQSEFFRHFGIGANPLSSPLMAGLVNQNLAQAAANYQGFLGVPSSSSIQIPTTLASQQKAQETTESPTVSVMAIPPTTTSQNTKSSLSKSTPTLLQKSQSTSQIQSKGVPKTHSQTSSQKPPTSLPVVPANKEQKACSQLPVSGTGYSQVLMDGMISGAVSISQIPLSSNNNTANKQTTKLLNFRKQSSTSQGDKACKPLSELGGSHTANKAGQNDITLLKTDVASQDRGQKRSAVSVLKSTGNHTVSAKTSTGSNTSLQRSVSVDNKGKTGANKGLCTEVKSLTPIGDIKNKAISSSISPSGGTKTKVLGPSLDTHRSSSAVSSCKSQNNSPPGISVLRNQQSSSLINIGHEITITPTLTSSQNKISLNQLQQNINVKTKSALDLPVSIPSAISIFPKQQDSSVKNYRRNESSVVSYKAQSEKKFKDSVSIVEVNRGKVSNIPLRKTPPSKPKLPAREGETGDDVEIITLD